MEGVYSMDAAELIQSWSKKVQVNISADRLFAYLTLITPEEGTEYLLDDILELLAAYKLTYKVDKEVIAEALAKKSYYVDLLVAQGIEPVAGTPGEFQFQFDTELNKKPIILEDGSTDYNTLGQMVLVKAGDILVKYKKAIPGIPGLDIFGNMISAPNAREFLPLKGKGFLVSEDETVYTAASDGKVEWKNERLNVQELLVIEDDVDATIGDIQFNGDILVKGNVLLGTTVKAAGNITVNGAVEAACLIAGKGVLLRSGMQGGGKGTISARETVSGKFFELATVITRGSIYANAIMNCTMDAGEDVVVSGKRGIIIGGITKAVGMITASDIGNKAETATTISVGLDYDFLEAMSICDEELAELSEKIRDTDRSLALITKRLMTNSLVILQEKRREFLKEVIGLKTKASVLTARRETMLADRERSTASTVVVLKTIHPGTKVSINGSDLQITMEYTDVTLKRKGLEVTIYANP